MRSFLGIGDKEMIGYSGKINLLKNEMLFVTNDVFGGNVKKSETKEKILRKMFKIYASADEEDIIKLLPYEGYKVLYELREYVKNSNDIGKFVERRKYEGVRYLERAMILVLRIKGAQYRYSLNEGVLEKIDNIFSKENRILAEKYGKMEKLIIGMMYSYGIMEFDEFRKKLCEYMNQDVDKEKINDLCFKRLTLNPFVSCENILWEDKGVRQEYVTYLNEEYFGVKIKDIIKQRYRKDVEYKEFTIDEILEREEYIWDKQTQELYDFVKSKNKKIFDISLKKLAKNIELGFKPVDEVLNLCKFEKMNEANNFLQMYMEWYKTRPQYALGGYSQMEFKEKFCKWGL